MSAIQTAKELFLKHLGKNHRRIESEMHRLGFTTFSRRRLYNHRLPSGKLRLGWIEKYGWRNELPETLTAPPSYLRKCSAFPEPRRSSSEATPPFVPNSSPVSEVTINASLPFRGHSRSFARERRLIAATSCNSETPRNSATLENFPSWLPQISPTLRWDWPYQKLIYEKLQAITDGSSKRLMIFLPPRHGKSELVTVRYTAWRLRNEPTLNVILGSYNQRLANRFSRKVRITWEDSLSTGAQASPPAAAATAADSLSNTRSQIRDPQSDCSSAAENPQSASSPPAAGVPAGASPRGVDGGGVDAEGGRGGGSPQSRHRLNTVAEWETGLGGGLRAVGVGGGITGFGAGLVIIDDPVKSRAEAESKTYREKLWEWYRDDLYTRLEPNASIILIQTRWHEDDLAGRLLKEMHDGGEHWDVISLPALAETTALPSYLRKSSTFPRDSQNNAEAPPPNAIGVYPCSSVAETSNPQSQGSPPYEGGVSAAAADGVVLSDLSSNPQSSIRIPQSPDPLGRKEGEPLCPDRFTRDDLLRIRRSLGTYSFSALYQQRPVPAEGGLFKRQWFTRVVDHAPQNVRWCRGYDLALSVKESADFTASFRCAIDHRTGDLYIADGFRKRIEFPDQRRYILARILDERFTEHGIEHALHGLAFIQEFRREHRLVTRSFRAVKVSADKFTRALSWANRAEEGKVVLVRGPWIDEFLEEAASFPNGAHDDQIDAVSIAVEMLNRHQHIARSF